IGAAVPDRPGEELILEQRRVGRAAERREVDRDGSGHHPAQHLPAGWAGRRACHAPPTRLSGAPSFVRTPRTSASSYSAAAIARSSAARSALADSSVISTPARALASRLALKKSSVMTSPSDAWRAWS